MGCQDLPKVMLFLLIVNELPGRQHHHHHLSVVCFQSVTCPESNGSYSPQTLNGYAFLHLARLRQLPLTWHQPANVLLLSNMQQPVYSVF